MPLVFLDEFHLRQHAAGCMSLASQLCELRKGCSLMAMSVMMWLNIFAVWLVWASSMATTLQLRVVEYHNKYIRCMVGLGFINGNNAPTEEEKCALPIGIELQQKRIDKTHDESIIMLMKTSHPSGVTVTLVYRSQRVREHK